MAIGKPEKICPHDRGTWKRDAKRARTKRMRLAVRQDPEAAPVKVGYWGWST